MTEAHGCGASQCHLRAVTPSGLVALDSYPLNVGDGLSDSSGHSMTPYMMEKKWESSWDPARVTRVSYDPQSSTGRRSPWAESSGQGSVLCNASNTDLSSCQHPNCLFLLGPTCQSSPALTQAVSMSCSSRARPQGSPPFT